MSAQRMYVSNSMHAVSTACSSVAPDSATHGVSVSEHAPHDDGAQAGEGGARDGRAAADGAGDEETSAAGGSGGDTVATAGSRRGTKGGSKKRLTGNQRETAERAAAGESRCGGLL